MTPNNLLGRFIEGFFVSSLDAESSLILESLEQLVEGDGLVAFGKVGIFLRWKRWVQMHALNMFRSHCIQTKH